MFSLLFSVTAYAATFFCEFSEEKMSANAWIKVDDQNRSFPVVTSELYVNEVEIPSISATCFYQNTPGQNGYRCSHKHLGSTFELYPKISGQVVESISMVRWDPREPVRSYRSKECVREN